MVNHQENQSVVMTQVALGRALGLSPAAITKLKQQGMPVDSVAAAQAWREQNLNIAARKPQPVGLGSGVSAAPGVATAFPPLAADQAGDFGDEDFQMARTRREIAEANLAEMREAELEGKLIRVDAVRSAWARGMAATRDALLQVPHRVAPLLAVETDLERIGQILDAELRQALTELTREGLQQPGGAG